MRPVVPFLLLPLLLALPTLALVAPAARAQVPPSGGLQTVTGTDGGYSIQLPADWQPQAVSLQEQVGGTAGGQTPAISLRLDRAYQSPDGSEQLQIVAISGIQVPPNALASRVQATVQAILGSSQAQAQLQAAGGGTLNVFSPPAPADVVNADAAAGGAANYTDPNGNARVVAVRGAAHGQTVYLLTLDVTQDFYITDPRFNAILNSFQLTH